MQTVFLAEDDENINEIVSEYLKEAGYAVVSVKDGLEAKKVISSTINMDLLILDIMLPGLSGLELLKIVRSDSRRKIKPVLMLTALTDETTQIAGFDGHADDYVTKPFSPKLLVKRVQALLRRSGHDKGQQDSVTIGTIRIDFAGYEAYEDNLPVMLTTLEFELMRVFAENFGRVLNRQQILDAVWGEDYYGDERIVDVHIKNLRKKFKLNFIATVKGAGYKLCYEEKGL